MNRITKPHFIVRPGDQLSFVRARTLHQIEVLSVGERRGPATEAQTLYRRLKNENEGS